MPMKQLRRRKKPRILIITPEITYLPEGMGNMANRMSAKAGGMADVSASLIAALFNKGADIHVCLPHYRRMFNVEVGRLIAEELRVYKSKLPTSRIHLAEDRIFYYRENVYRGAGDDTRVALAFQREALNNIISMVKPDLIHCNDWMTGLIPGAARRQNIPCLFTVHNIHTQRITLAQIEDAGIDAAEFWPNLFYTVPPGCYEETRDTVPVDLLTSGIFGAHFINTVSPTFLSEVVEGRHDFVPEAVRYEMACKRDAGCAAGILNAPDPVYDPAADPMIEKHYEAQSHAEGKRENKLHFQEKVGLHRDSGAPLFFWPSRLDPVQKGCQLLTDILYDTVAAYAREGMQIAVVASGAYEPHLHDIVRFHDLYGRVAVCGFDEALSHLGYAASDFMLIPSLFEPCGLPQMISSIYGSLPIAHDTGGLHDTVVPLDAGAGTGNGFRFENYDSGGLRWAIDCAMAFYRLPEEQRAAQVSRVMRESGERFTHAAVARRYIEIYEKMLQRPLVEQF
ncbi:glycogen synthase [Kiritimatiella glycovorans]|uniref:starch synthase n=1 Tax=Kiritimatiella glycovorans TaxID=1307763 RepID=A0A0G3EEC4_9BACT|nr:glycogen/starch synthase [Kiritimatiella glycovorans]AKJ63772.1 Glycogen synthase [Kiritimatiella glycovorans]